MGRLKMTEQATFEGVPIFQDEVERGEWDGISLEVFLKTLLIIVFYPVIFICNSFKLRSSFFKKEKCSVKILKKEPKEIGMESSFGDFVKGIFIKTFLLHFEIKGRQASIKVNEKVFMDYTEGDQLSIKYIEGLDRFHVALT